MALFYFSNEETKEEVEMKEKWYAFQYFERLLSIEEFKKVRRYLIGIEKTLFGKEASK